MELPSDITPLEWESLLQYACEDAVPTTQSPTAADYVDKVRDGVVTAVRGVLKRLQETPWWPQGYSWIFVFNWNAHF